MHRYKEKFFRILTLLFVYILRRACSILREKVRNKRSQKYCLLIV